MGIIVKQFIVSNILRKKDLQFRFEIEGLYFVFQFTNIPHSFELYIAYYKKNEDIR